MSVYDELAALGSATVHEAAGRTGVVDVPLIQVLPGSRAAGPAASNARLEATGTPHR